MSVITKKNECLLVITGLLGRVVAMPKCWLGKGCRVLEIMKIRG